MEFGFTPEEEAFRQQVKHFFEQEVVYPPGWKAYRQLTLREEDLPFIQELARRLGEKGWLSLAWPKEYGGREAPILDAILAEEVHYYGVAYARDVLGVGELAPILIKFGTEEQKRRHLPPIARGGVSWAQGYSEPEAGSDLAGVQLRAEELNNHFLLNGQKLWTDNAHNADWIFLLARTDPQATPRHRGISFLLADMRTPGITVRPLIDITESHRVNEVFFDNVRVPKENLVGEKNQGFYVAMGLLEFERGSGQYAGNARRVFEQMVEYSKEKGGLSPQLRQKLGGMAVEIEVARWLNYRNLWLQHQDIPSTVGPPMYKLFVSEMGRRVYEAGMEVLGLYSQLKGDSQYAQLEGELAFEYFSSIEDTIGAGTSEIQRTIIATRGLGLPRG